MQAQLRRLPGQNHGESLFFSCVQSELADLLECSDRTLRNEFDRLYESGALETRPHSTLPNFIAYRFDLPTLEALPESLTPELDEVICEWIESLQESNPVSDPVTISSDARAVELVSGPVSGQISATVSGPLSGGLSGPVSGQISALTDNDNHHHHLISNHDDDHHQVDECSTTTAVWDMTSQEPLSFREIRDSHAEAIAGKAVEGAVLSLRQRWVLFMRYWADVKVTEKRPVGQEDAVQLLALFVYWGRAKTNKSRGGAIRTWWGNRLSQPIVDTVKASLIDEARRIMAAGLGTVQRPAQAPSVPPRVPEGQRIKRLNLEEMKERIQKAKEASVQPCQ